MLGVGRRGARPENIPDAQDVLRDLGVPNDRRGARPENLPDAQEVLRDLGVSKKYLCAFNDEAGLPPVFLRERWIERGPGNLPDAQEVLQAPPVSSHTPNLTKIRALGDPQTNMGCRAGPPGNLPDAQEVPRPWLDPPTPGERRWHGVQHQSHYQVFFSFQKRVCANGFSCG